MVIEKNLLKNVMNFVKKVAASPLWGLRALVLKRRFARMRVWDPGEDSAEQGVPDDLGTGEEDAWDQWRSQLMNQGGEHRGTEAVLPNWGTWRSCRGLPLTYRITQVLTGHGVFGEYLMKFGRETTDICHHGGEGREHSTRRSFIRRGSCPTTPCGTS
ncbi:uncharacterized protein LOC122568108 [Bombus pyrosoma]|uniref:uncharacterized protein LOC122568108 n=1 Tax=Bombus pyrosoma TaxID=396416 RepID=UPI001CB94C72|nr:uncharacterized protein LOC122568108 [Bombus pyrosoma]